MLTIFCCLQKYNLKSKKGKLLRQVGPQSVEVPTEMGERYFCIDLLNLKVETNVPIHRG